MIDRDPTHFHRILDFLRTGNANTDDMTEDEKSELDEELDYYQISFPTIWCWRKHMHVELSCDDTIVEKIGKSFGRDSSAIGDRPLDTFAIKLIDVTPNSTLMIGLAPSTAKIDGNFSFQLWLFHFDCWWNVFTGRRLSEELLF